MNKFQRDNAWQRAMRDTILVPLFYEKRFPGAYELIEPSTPRSAGGVDVIIRGTITIDEKIVRFPDDRDEPYTAYAFEMDSNTHPGFEKEGWMVTNVVEWLLYCFASKDEYMLSCHLIPFRELQEWFLVRARLEYWPVWFSDQINRSRCFIVPFKDVAAAMKVRVFNVISSPDQRMIAGLKLCSERKVLTV